MSAEITFVQASATAAGWVFNPLEKPRPPVHVRTDTCFSASIRLSASIAPAQGGALQSEAVNQSFRRVERKAVIPYSEVGSPVERKSTANSRGGPHGYVAMLWLHEGPSRARVRSSSDRVAWICIIASSSFCTYWACPKGTERRRRPFGRRSRSLLKLANQPRDGVRFCVPDPR